MTDPQLCLLCRPGRERQAVDGHVACWTCWDRLAESLDDLGRLAVQLDARPRAGGMDGGRRAPGFESKPPVDLHALALLDPRTAPDKQGALHSPSNFAISWARWIRQQRGQMPAALPVAAAMATLAELHYLYTALDWITRQEWVVTFAEQLRPVVRQCDGQVTGFRAPRPWGKCTAVVEEHTEDAPERRCEQPMYAPRAGSDTARCRACGAEYKPLDALLSLAE